MATLARIFSAALFLLLPVAAFAGPAEEANEAVDRWVAAYNSNDLNAITNMYTPDAILLGRVSPVLSQGPQAIHDFFLKSMGSGKTNTVGERRTIVIDDNAVVVTGFDDFTRMADRLPIPGPARFTMVMVRRDGEWRIVHHHSSPRPH